MSMPEKKERTDTCLVQCPRPFNDQIIELKRLVFELRQNFSPEILVELYRAVERINDGKTI